MCASQTGDGSERVDASFCDIGAQWNGPHGENEDDGDEECQQKPAGVSVTELIRGRTGSIRGAAGALISAFVHSLLPSRPFLSSSSGHTHGTCCSVG